MKRILYTIAAIAAMTAVSCINEQDVRNYGDEFSIEGDPAELYVASDGLSISEDDKSLNRFTVRSDAKWRFKGVNDTTYNWVRIFPDEGTLDGYFYIIVEKSTETDVRHANYDIIVNGEVRGSFAVHQSGIEPYLRTNITGKRFNRGGGNGNVGIISNIDYELVMPDANDANPWTDWVKVSKLTRDSLCFKVLPNQDNATRTCKLTLRGKEDRFSSITAELEIEETTDDGSLLARWTFVDPSTLSTDDKAALFNTKEHWLRSDDLKSIFFWYKKVPDPGETCTYKMDNSVSYVRYLITGLAMGDYFQIDVPLKDLPAGYIEYSIHHTSSAGGMKFWLAQWSIGNSDWNDIDADIHSEAFGPESSYPGVAHDIYYTYAISPVNNTAGEFHHFLQRFPIPAVHGEQVLHLRHTAVDMMNNARTKNVSAGHGGTTRVATEIAVSYIPKD